MTRRGPSGDTPAARFYVAMELFEAKNELARALCAREAYRHAAAVMNYDGMTSAPKNSAPGRAASLAALGSEERKLMTGRELIRALDALLQHADELDEKTRREAELTHREVTRLLRVPAGALAEHNRVLGMASAVWREAKARNDFKLFSPYLTEVFASARKLALLTAPEKDPYDTLLDENEEGMSRAFLDPFFSGLREALVPLIGRIAKRPKPDVSFLHGHFPREKQLAFSRELMGLMGIDGRRCSLGCAEHPYTTFINRNDVRVTTHIYEDRVHANMFSILHEGGHALYELGISEELTGSPLGHGASAGMHESQSRLYENLIGRSRGFAELILPVLKRYFPEELGGVGASEFYLAVNRAEPTNKRTDADELTYCLHVMIRYELEKALIRGDISAEDVPRRWNALCGEYLGVVPETDSEGCLQDMHWGSGLIGYFPTYALGNAYGAQLFHWLLLDPEANAAFERGDIPAVTGWLRERVHKYGKLKTPAELIADSTGEGFTPEYYLEYLTEKYTAMYGL